MASTAFPQVCEARAEKLAGFGVRMEGLIRSVDGRSVRRVLRSLQDSECGWKDGWVVEGIAVACRASSSLCVDGWIDASWGVGRGCFLLGVMWTRRWMDGLDRVCVCVCFFLSVVQPLCGWMDGWMDRGGVGCFLLGFIQPLTEGPARSTYRWHVSHRPWLGLRQRFQGPDLPVVHTL
eukprot:366462-Chlamydomonas_euryale.AAC.1